MGKERRRAEMINKEAIIYDFGKEVIVKTRDMTIEENFDIVEGNSNAPSDVALHNELKTLTEEQRDAVKKLIINSIDSSINNFIWNMEESGDKYSFVAKCEDSTEFNIEKESDGLGMGQYVFIERYSKYNDILDILETGRISKKI